MKVLFLVLLSASGLSPAVVTPYIPKSLGFPAAPVKIEFYSDFQAVESRTLYLDTIRPLTEDYVRKGKVYLVYHDLPLPSHNFARSAALYAAAADKFGRFALVSDVLFQKQSTWAADGKIDQIVATVLTPAQMKRVRVLITQASLITQLDKEVELGKKEALAHTPALVITSKSDRHALGESLTYANIKLVLDKALVGTGK